MQRKLKETAPHRGVGNRKTQQSTQVDRDNHLPFNKKRKRAKKEKAEGAGGGERRRRLGFTNALPTTLSSAPGLSTRERGGGRLPAA